MFRVQRSLAFLSATLIIALAPSIFHAFPSVYPTGTTIYQPDKAWNGYTIFPTPEAQGAVLIDMNGNLIRRFEETAFRLAQEGKYANYHGGNPQTINGPSRQKFTPFHVYGKDPISV